MDALTHRPGDHMRAEPTLSLSAAHLSEIDRIQAADAAVQRMVHDLCDAIQRAGELLPSPGYETRRGKTVLANRYADLIQGLTDVLHDEMPAPREFADDPFEEARR
jgi:hypothetical protein